jgi:hypothetical protein
MDGVLTAIDRIRDGDAAAVGPDESVDANEHGADDGEPLATGSEADR